MKIKGNTQIILTDAKTGEVVKHTNDDNMVTNGIFEFIKCHGMTVMDLFNNAEVKNNPLTTLLGGVYLFHDSQTEDANNFKPDGGNALTANGAYDVTTSQGRTLGNFNASESGWMSDNIFRFVYDWTSAQGNGVISSVSLTSRIAGALGLGKNVKPLANLFFDSYTTYIVTFNERAMLYDATNNDRALGIQGNYLYSYHFTGSNGDAFRDLVIHRQHICNTEMAFDDSYALKPITSSRVESVATFQNVGNRTEGDTYPCIHAYGYYWMLTSIQHEYTLINAPQGEDRVWGVAWRMLRIKDDFTTCDTSEILASGVFGTTNNYDLRNDYKLDHMLDRQAGFFPTGEDSFTLHAVFGNAKDSEHAQPYFTYKLYNGTFTSPTAVMSSGGVIHSYSEGYFPSMLLHTNILYHANGISFGGNWIGTEDGDLWECDALDVAGGRGIGMTDKSLFCYVGGNANVNVGRIADYLASINNLNSPVTKDNTQNMKLIYTLTFTD